MSTDTSATDSVITTVIGTTSTSLTTSFSTTVTVTGPSSTPDTVTSDTSSPSTITSSVSIPPSTTVVTASTTPVDTSPSVVAVTETITQTPAPSSGVTQSPSVVVVTSTLSQDTPTSNTATTSVTPTSSNTSPTPSTLSASGSGSGSSSGLSSGAKIAIAVIIPIVVIAAAFLIGFFCWRKRKARKNAEELRKSEMAEYGFNPNSDPTLGVATAAYTDNQSEGQDDNSGYRGWGATSSNRKASTTLGSNGRAAGGPALSESSSQPGGYAAQASPNATSDQYSADPLMNGHPEGGDGVAALGTVGGLNRHRSGTGDIRRGPSNASSAYSSGHHSEASSDAPQMPGPYYQEEVPYNIYNDANPSHGPYGDGSYGGSGTQPVIRDNQARRSARVERAPTFPQAQGGISQNF
ncbi:uncharacterized protein Z519_07958 [Cladophialophora bantiana CBS 173.52]|uniref:Mid2 domain-containing protein n=1 Tax=Cladophialophora bantiana (strain ATCC 10958 / CBS 173.52 / CDC B-1940 / NIH 8579) TaxID=1442370 RepID=A0A0D2I2I2_CLAB1|nr:uncharacterized protein Z519_07958 [Cladophialophora bantiana CBS 173.52]KIW91064.1 hypothetical protein Z519_07958 [Cladophialophora bantiana CBS 173.52]